MGLNHKRRPPREDLDSPNDFVTVAYGETDIALKEHDVQLIMEFEDGILRNTRERLRDLSFD